MTIHKMIKELGKLDLQQLEDLKLSDIAFLVEIINNLVGTGTLNDEEIKEYLEDWKIARIKKIAQAIEVD